MLGHKFLNPDWVLYIFHVSVGICFVYNVLYFLRFITRISLSLLLKIVALLLLLSSSFSVVIIGHTWGVQEKKTGNLHPVDLFCTLTSFCH